MFHFKLLMLHTILIVDDDPLFARQIKGELLARDYLVHDQICSTAGKALEIARSHKIDFALIDVHLEVPAAGLTLAAKLNNQNIPFIIYTAHHTAEIFTEAKALGPYSYLVRPFDGQALDHAIQLALRHHAVASASTAPFLVKDRQGCLVALNTDEIRSIQSVGNYCYFRMREESLSLRGSLSSVFKDLSDEHFVRTHRGYVVAWRYIDRINVGEEYLLVDGQRLPIGGKYKRQLLDAFKRRNN